MDDREEYCAEQDKKLSEEECIGVAHNCRCLNCEHVRGDI